MLIPLRHESRGGPSLAANLHCSGGSVVFLATHGQIEDQSPKNGGVRAHILLLAAMRPELKTPPEVQEFCDNLSATTSRHVERGATSEPGCG
jgi:hypothetical protein